MNEAAVIIEDLNLLGSNLMAIWNVASWEVKVFVIIVIISSILAFSSKKKGV